MRAYEGNAVCKKGWHILSVSSFGGQHGGGKWGTSGAAEEAGAEVKGLLRQALGVS